MDRNNILVYHALHFIEDFPHPRTLKCGSGKIHSRAYASQGGARSCIFAWAMQSLIVPLLRAA